MHIILSPRHGRPGQPETTIHVAGDTAIVDGTPYDLSSVPEGGEGWPEAGHPIRGPVRRIGGVIHCGIRVVLGETAARHQPDDPAHWVVDVAAGPVTIPAIRKPEGPPDV